jgi:hypothetical protein
MTHDYSALQQWLLLVVVVVIISYVLITNYIHHRSSKGRGIMMSL